MGGSDEFQGLDASITIVPSPEVFVETVNWHLRGAEKFEQAERAYRQSLAIEVQRENRPGEAISLMELGTLYDCMGRLEEAVAFTRQAADIYSALQNLSAEGACRHNLAGTLIKLQQHNEARVELYRAIECNNPFGHASQPWKSWALLHDLEQAIGNVPAAADARQQAVQCYLESWLAEDATDNPDDIQQAQTELDAFTQAINTERERAGARRIYP